MLAFGKQGQAIIAAIDNDVDKIQFDIANVCKDRMAFSEILVFSVVKT